MASQKFYRRRTENLYTVVGAAVQQHLRKFRIIVDGRCKACSACLICRAVRHIVLNAKVIVQITDGRLSLPAVIHLRQTILLFCRNPEIGIVHAERLENFFFQKIPKAHAACHLNHRTYGIRRRSITPGLARLIQKRDFSKTVCKFYCTDRSAVFFLKSVDHLLKKCIGLPSRLIRSAVRQPGCHIHNILQKDLPLRFFYLPIRCTYNRVPEARQILADRIRQIDDSALYQNHHGRRGNRLAHGVEAENIIAGNRLFCFDIRISALQINLLLSVFDHHQKTARCLSFCNGRIHHLLQSFLYHLFHGMS